MAGDSLAIIIGGLLPALLFGLTGVLQKASASCGIGTGPYLLMIAAGVGATGLVFCLLAPSQTSSASAYAYSMLTGISWAGGMGLVLIALTRFEAPLSRLVPLYNMNTLVAVTLALIIFAEWKDVQTTKLLCGALLITIGGTLVANS